MSVSATCFHMEVMMPLRSGEPTLFWPNIRAATGKPNRISYSQRKIRVKTVSRSGPSKNWTWVGSVTLTFDKCFTNLCKRLTLTRGEDQLLIGVHLRLHIVATYYNYTQNITITHLYCHSRITHCCYVPITITQPAAADTAFSPPCSDFGIEAIPKQRIASSNSHLTAEACSVHRTSIWIGQNSYTGSVESLKCSQTADCQQLPFDS